jgi:hypothetical protein
MPPRCPRVRYQCGRRQIRMAGSCWALAPTCPTMQFDWPVFGSGRREERPGRHHRETSDPLPMLRPPKTQETPVGAEIPVPTWKEVYEALRKVVRGIRTKCLRVPRYAARPRLRAARVARSVWGGRPPRYMSSSYTCPVRGSSVWCMSSGRIRWKMRNTVL